MRLPNQLGSSEKGTVLLVFGASVYFSRVHFFGVNHLAREFLQCNQTTFHQTQQFAGEGEPIAFALQRLSQYGGDVMLV